VLMCSCLRSVFGFSWQAEGPVMGAQSVTKGTRQIPAPATQPYTESVSEIQVFGSALCRA
jgi:hypothetical protein